MTSAPQPAAGRNDGAIGGIVRKPLVLVLGAVGVAVAVLRRRQTRADAALWREATSDSSR
jgi:hypothetical protein